MKIKNVEKKKGKNKVEAVTQRKVTRSQMKTRVRVDTNIALKLLALMVDERVSKATTIRVQCEDALYGSESFTYLTWSDFEAVFTMDQVTGAVVTSYTMFLYEQIKNGRQKDHEICFMSPTSVKPLAKQMDDSSSCIADRLATRGNNDIILLPYNPGGHWVLVVLLLKNYACFYLDSLGGTPSLHLKQTIEIAMSLNNIQIGSTKRASKLHWLETMCPLQPGSTKCGYYMLKYMKEIVNEGADILVNNIVGGTKAIYNDADMDEVRNDWAQFVANFIYMH